MNDKKIGIFTWHFWVNFGSSLQAYALKETVKSLGLDVEIIDYRPKKIGLIYIVKSIISKFLKLNIRSYKFIGFQRKYMNLSLLVLNPNKLNAVSKKYHTIIVGSDQVWAPTMFDPNYFLSFVQNTCKKVSYAPSIGFNDIPKTLCSEYKHLLSDFHKISIRESVGKKLLKEKCNIESTLVLDPTLLLTKEQYEKIESNPIKIKKYTEKPFVFCYFLNQNHKYRQAVLALAQEHKLNIIGWSLNENDSEWMHNVSQYIGPREFLWLVHNASVVITDSYHGTIFSILYKKPFITFERFDKNSPICQNSRIYQLSEYFCIEKNIFPGDTQRLEVFPVDYEKISVIHNQLKEKSLKFLKEAIEEI